MERRGLAEPAQSASQDYPKLISRSGNTPIAARLWLDWGVIGMCKPMVDALWTQAPAATNVPKHLGAVPVGGFGSLGRVRPKCVPVQKLFDGGGVVGPLKEETANWWH